MAPLKFVSVVLCSILSEAAAYECISFGKNSLAEDDQCQSESDLSPLLKTLDFKGEATWAVELDDSLAVLIGDAVQFWTGGSDFTEIELGGLTTPVGAVQLDGKLYVACFGSWPDPADDSGLAIIDIAGQSLESTHSFSDSAMHVHNVYAFDFGGNTEIFAAVLGNPWTGPIAGRGLSRFDRESGSFDLDTTDGRLNVRSAKQQMDGTIFVLTQEPAGEQTVLASLVEASGQLQIAAQTLLPQREDGDGGADVVLGFEMNTIWVTDRGDQSGKLYHYTYVDGDFFMTATRETGANPRYAVALDNGDIVVCNQNGNDLSVYQGLAASPMDESIFEVRVPTVDSPMFFMKTSPSPSPLAGGQIQSTSSSLCIDLPGGDTSNGALLWTWECYGGDSQQWSFQDGQLVYLPDPSKCVDLLGGDSTNGNQLGLWDCYQGDSQLWGFDPEWGTIFLASSTASDATKCAQIGGENLGDPLVIWDCTVEPSQVWNVGSLQSSLTVV